MSARPTEMAKLVAGDFDHGTRARYVAGKCRCDPCRSANTQYARDRAAARKIAAVGLLDVDTATGVKAHGRITRTYKRMCPGVAGLPCAGRCYLRKDSTGSICARCRESLTRNALVDAGPARKHLAALSAAGVGRRAVRAACDVADSLLHQVARGTRRKIRQETERRILAVDVGARSDGSLVPARETRARLRFMLARGMTKTELARELGSEGHAPALQIAFGRRAVTAANALKVERLHRRFVDQLAEERAVERSQAYTLEDRLAILRRARDVPSEYLLLEFPHVWANARTIARDRAALATVEKKTTAAVAKAIAEGKVGASTTDAADAKAAKKRITSARTKAEIDADIAEACGAEIVQRGKGWLRKWCDACRPAMVKASARASAERTAAKQRRERSARG